MIIADRSIRGYCASGPECVGNHFYRYQTDVIPVIRSRSVAFYCEACFRDQCLAGPPEFDRRSWLDVVDEIDHETSARAVWLDGDPRRLGRR